MTKISTLWAAPALKRMAFALLFITMAVWVQAADFTSIAGTGTWNAAGTWTVVGTDADGIPDADDNVVINGTVNMPNNINYTIINLTINNGKTLGFGNRDLTVNGTVTVIGNGAFSGSRQIIYGTTKALVYSGTVARTTTNQGWPSVNGPTSVTIMNTAGVTLHAARTITTLSIGDGTINGVLNDAGFQITASNLNIASGTLKLGTATLATTLPTANPANTAITGGTVEFASGLDQTIPADNYFNLTSSGTGARTLASSGTIGIAGTFTKGGNTYTVTGSTVNFNGTTNQTIPAFIFHNLSVTSPASTTTKTLSGAIVVNNDFTMGANTSLDVTAANYAISAAGNWTNNGTLIPHSGTVTLNGTDQIINTSAISTFYNLTLSGTGTKTVTTGALPIAHNLNVSTSGTVLDLGIYPANNPNNNGTLTVANLATLKIGSGIVPLGYSTYDFKENSTVEYYGGGTRAETAQTYGNVKITGATTLQANGTFTIAGNMMIGTGATFNATNDPLTLRSHTIKGDWTNDGTFNASTSTISFNGTVGTQTIGGGQQTTFENLVVDNANGITLNQTVAIDGDGSLTFNKDNGLINSSRANPLILGPNTYNKINNVSKLRFVNGPVQKVGNDAFTFPIGKLDNGVYRYVPLKISAPANTADAFTAEYVPESGTALGPISTNARNQGLAAVSNCEYWILDRTSGTSIVDVTLTWNKDNNKCSGATYINQPSSLVVVHYSDNTVPYNGQWDNFSQGADNYVDPNSTAASGEVTWKNVSTFSPFTIGTTNGELNPLPVTFVSFTGRKAEGGTQLSWNVAGESNVKGYDVERKTAGGQFAKIGHVAATGSTTYTFTDAATQKGVVFYRLKNVDGDGRFAYSTVLSFKNGAGVVVLPTVVTGKTTVLHDAAGAGAYISLSTADGRQVKVQRPQAGSAQTTVDMTGLRAGMYLLRWSDGAGHTETVKLVKQ